MTDDKTATPTVDEVGVKTERSSGKSKAGIPIFYVRPAISCYNKSRRYVGYQKMNAGIKRWYYPKVRYFLVDNYLIGANKEKNSLKEYWRICDTDKIGVEFKVVENK